MAWLLDMGRMWIGMKANSFNYVWLWMCDIGNSSRIERNENYLNYHRFYSIHICWYSRLIFASAFGKQEKDLNCDWGNLSRRCLPSSLPSTFIQSVQFHDIQSHIQLIRKQQENWSVNKWSEKKRKRRARKKGGEIVILFYGGVIIYLPFEFLCVAHIIYRVDAYSRHW